MKEKRPQPPVSKVPSEVAGTKIEDKGSGLECALHKLPDQALAKNLVMLTH